MISKLRVEIKETLFAAVPVRSIYRDGIRSSWIDGKVRRLEDHLPEIIATLSLHAEAIRRRKAEWAAQEKRWEEERRRQELREKRAQEERGRRAELVRFASGWRQATGIREFLKEVDRRKDEFDAGSRSKVEKWMTWARRVADDSDPFENGGVVGMLDRRSAFVASDVE